LGCEPVSHLSLWVREGAWRGGGRSSRLEGRGRGGDGRRGGRGGRGGGGGVGGVVALRVYGDMLGKGGGQSRLLQWEG